MKTLKVILILIAIFMISRESHSYIVYVSYPNPCEDLPSHLSYPPVNFNVNFIIQRAGVFDTDLAGLKIVVIQNGNNAIMYQGTVLADEALSIPLNLLNLPNVCFNEKIKIVVEAFPQGYFNSPDYGYGYVVVHKNEISCINGSLLGGTPTLLLNNQRGTFFTTSECSPVASGTYIVKQYRVRFALDYNSNDSILELDTSLCVGFSGGLPNHQKPWARIVSISNNQAILETFVYELTDIAGRYIGWTPTNIPGATIVYHFIRRPVIGPITMTPNVLTPSHNVGRLYSPLIHGPGIYEWRDTNLYRNEYTFIRSQGPYAVVVRNFSQNLHSLAADYMVRTRAINLIGRSPWREFSILWDYDPPPGCPSIRYSNQGYDIFENTILPGSPDSPGKIITDYMKPSYPFPDSSGVNEFQIYEPENSVTSLDELAMLQVNVDPNEDAVISQSGEVASYTKEPGKGKILMNSSDISDIVSEKDNIMKEVDKGDVMDVMFPQDGSQFIDIYLGNPVIKRNIIGEIIANDGSEYKFYARESGSNVCIKLNSPGSGDFKIKFEQKCKIDQIQIIKNTNNFEIVNCTLKEARDGSGDIQNLIKDTDGKYATITNNNPANFVFAKMPAEWKKPVYFIKSAGKYIEGSPLRNELIKPKPENKNTVSYVNKLYDNSPNPFNPSTNIKFEIQNDALVKLSVYDITGREIKTLLSEFKKAGSYDIRFDGSGFASGIYFYKLETAGFKVTKRMILIK